MKAHKMYCKDGSVHNVTSLKKHNALKKKGCGHKKKKDVNYKPMKGFNDKHKNETRPISDLGLTDKKLIHGGTLPVGGRGVKAAIKAGAKIIKKLRDK